MKKRIIAMLLAVMTVFGAVMFMASAESDDVLTADTNEEETSFVQWQVGDIIPAGGKIQSGLLSPSLNVIYTATVDENAGFDIKSELKTTQFRDSVADLQGETYQGAYTVKNLGDSVLQYYDAEKGEWLSVAPGAVASTDDTWVDEALRKNLPTEITIDFKADDHTARGYVEFAGWQVVSVSDTATGMDIKLNATWKIRDGEWWEDIIEVFYSAFVNLVNAISDFLSVSVPNFILTWAELLGFGA